MFNESRLLVDIGNTRIKSAWQSGSELTVLEPVDWRDRHLDDVFNQLWVTHSGTVGPSVYVSNVAGEAVQQALHAWCVRNWHVAPLVMSSTLKLLDLTHGYRDPHRFGVDRWMALAGARRHVQGPLCVIDCGTATTVDLLTASGRHLGGAILPGMRTMRRALGRCTSALPDVEGCPEPFSDNTIDGIAGGTTLALTGAVDRFIDEGRRLQGTVTAVLTGGEAPLVLPRLHNVVCHEPDLVLHGIAAAADEACATIGRPQPPMARRLHALA